MQSLDRERRIEQAIAGGLRSAIEAHGPITKEQVASAVKRVKGNLRGQRLLAEEVPPQR